MPPLTIKNIVIQPTLSLLVNVAHVVSQNGHQWMLVYKGHRQKTCLKKEYHIINNATKKSTNKIHNGRAKATYEKGKRSCTAASLNKRRQEDHLPLVYLNPRQHLRSIPEITISTKINASSAKKSQEYNFTVFQQRTWVYRSGKLVRRWTVEV